MNQRSTALNILHKTIKDESYSNLLMRSELNKLVPVQRAFVTELVNGVLRNYDYLMYQFENEIDSRTSLKNKLIIALALYERFFLEQKDYVVNNEYVELADSKYDKAFINAILHKIVSFKDTDIIYIKNSIPKWIYSLLSSQYSEEELLKILSVYRTIPKLYYRINKARAKMSDFENINIINEDLFTSDENLLHSDEYKNGYFYVQDYNSASLYKHLDLEKNNTFLDMCCAPGSKLFNCLDILDEKNCFANDIHSHRVELIEKAALRLGYKNINYTNFDGTTIDKELHLKFDRILLDAPCSGLGVIGRKPDLKFHIKPDNLDELQELQAKLLDSASKLLKRDGILLYSTCTLNKKENNRMMIRFVSEHEDFYILEEDTIINELGDCFYYCKLKRI